jgi:predicted DsbA family dithiol-disulfide isomerase
MTRLKIDFVSDVSCPWCAIGLASLGKALQRLEAEVEASIHFQPFELNPDMPRGGQDTTSYLTAKYGTTPEQQEATRAAIRERGAAAGFEFHPGGRARVYNTFDAHRLLHWAGQESPAAQLALKSALMVACHREQRAMDEHSVLVECARAAGLDAGRARAILASDEFAAAVRERERFYSRAGIHAVPAVIVDERHVISGGQPAEVFEEALRRIAAAA